MTTPRIVLALLIAALVGCASQQRAESSFGDSDDAVVVAPPPDDVDETPPKRDDPPLVIAAADDDPEVAVADDEPEVAPPKTPEEPVEPVKGIRVYTQAHVVELDAFVCLDYGWLEQVACAPQSREHESLVVVPVMASELHFALLLAGFEPGSPGRWRYVEEREDYEFIKPTGAELEVSVRYERDGEAIEEPIRNWIQDHLGETPFPKAPWVFGGSVVEPNPEWMEPGEHYIADFTGSLIGLVTFGDETVGWSRVMADEASVHEPEWEVRDGHVPPMGTQVVVVVKAWESE